MTQEARLSAVLGFRDLVFVERYLRDSQGLWQAYAIDEAPRHPPGLGKAVNAALEAPWPDISPAWAELISPILKRTKMSSNRRFVTRSTRASVRLSDGLLTVTPWKPDGVGGYSGVLGGPSYELRDPTPSELGSSILRALVDSANFPDRPKQR